MYHIFCIHSSVEGHLGSFQLLAIINKAAMNIVEHVSFLLVGTSSGYMPRRGMVGSSSSTSLSQGFYSCTNIMTKKQVGEERVYSAYTSILLFITKGNQDRSSHMEGTWRQELI